MLGSVVVFVTCPRCLFLRAENPPSQGTPRSFNRKLFRNWHALIPWPILQAYDGVVVEEPFQCLPHDEPS